MACNLNFAVPELNMTNLRNLESNDSPRFPTTLCLTYPHFIEKNNGITG